MQAAPNALVGPLFYEIITVLCRRDQHPNGFGWSVFFWLEGRESILLTRVVSNTRLAHRAAMTVVACVSKLSHQDP